MPPPKLQKRNANHPYATQQPNARPPPRLKKKNANNPYATQATQATTVDDEEKADNEEKEADVSESSSGVDIPHPILRDRYGNPGGVLPKPTLKRKKANKPPKDKKKKSKKSKQ